VIRVVSWAVGFVLLFLFFPVRVGGCSESPVTVVSFDSGTRVVREIAEALSGEGCSILEAYPRGSEIFLGLVSLLPEGSRIAMIEWGMRRSLGHHPGRAADVSVDALAKWCVAQYAGDKRYPVILLGSPNGAVAHLGALLGAPLLTTSFGLTFRHPPIDPDDLASYRETSLAAAERIVESNPGGGYEIVCHYDPVHDRSMVQAADFVRIKLHDLPDAYRGFIRDRLAPGGTLVTVDCAYRWPQIALAERIFLQIGGLGAIDPAEYLEEWAPTASVEIRRESEWGCPEPFAQAVIDCAEELAIDWFEIARDHPAEYSLLAYEAYLSCDDVRPNAVLVDSFNHQNPRTNLVTGIPGLWLPFNTADGLDLVSRAWSGKDVDAIYFAPLPSFAGSPDTVTIEAWEEHLAFHGTIEWIGIRPDKHPADPLAPYRLARAMKSLRATYGQETPLHLPVEMLKRVLSTMP